MEWVCWGRTIVQFKYTGANYTVKKRNCLPLSSFMPPSRIKSSRATTIIRTRFQLQIQIIIIIFFSFSFFFLSSPLSFSCWTFLIDVVWWCPNAKSVINSIISLYTYFMYFKQYKWTQGVSTVDCLKRTFNVIYVIEHLFGFNYCCVEEWWLINDQVFI